MGLDPWELVVSQRRTRESNTYHVTPDCHGCDTGREGEGDAALMMENKTNKRLIHWNVVPLRGRQGVGELFLVGPSSIRD